jgi:hypothetical protein
LELKLISKRGKVELLKQQLKKTTLRLSSIANSPSQNNMFVSDQKQLNLQFGGFALRQAVTELLKQIEHPTISSHHEQLRATLIQLLGELHTPKSSLDMYKGNVSKFGTNDSF